MNIASTHSIVPTTTGDCKMYATEKQNRGSDCSLIVVSLTTENNRIIHIRGSLQSLDWNGGMEWWNGIVECVLWGERSLPMHFSIEVTPVEWS